MVLLLTALLAYQRHLMLGAADFHGVTVGDIEKKGKRINDPDWAGSSEAFNDAVLDTKAN